jgi:hypothetical protein
MMGSLNGKTIRLCLGCNNVYLDSTNNFGYIRPCKWCEAATGFFSDLDHFFGYIGKYGLDTDQIKDEVLLAVTCKHFGISLNSIK